MLDNAMLVQLKTYLEMLQAPVEVVASLDASSKSQEMRALLDNIAKVSRKIHLRYDGEYARKPSFSVGVPGETPRIRFAAVPMGHEFSSLVLALLHTGGHPPKLEPDVVDEIRSICGNFRFETFISLSCHNCPDVVQSLNLMAALNPGISHTMIDGMLFKDEIEQHKIMAVPTIHLNGEFFSQGRKTVEEIVAKIDTGVIAREAGKISAKQVFDVLVVGGGPAGATAAIYASRKGVRTGVVAERFGGQVLDTQTIENFISVKETDGAKLAAELEEHVRDYDVDIMNLQIAVALTQGLDGLSEIRMASGAVLKSRTVVISTGARWREMNIPGEKKYRGRGVAYCPHCDGPLFRGKRVAVIGGGNSGVEAAIDLAGVVAHVTLIEFDTELHADAVLQNKLYSLPNVEVITSAQTTEVLGNDEKVVSIVYQDRVSGEQLPVELEGIFVQIGLLPNTDWLKGTLALSPSGEIEIDARGQTSLPGVFAAGDCTTVPYKQIIIAMGEGAKASISAFDHLVRNER
ncbi:MAG: alkyl hydroperoxide reductase subunit F [Betaproteobacteria bacterium]